MYTKVELKKFTDMQVITLCLTENRQYYDEIVARYKNLVYSLVAKMVNDREDVKDLVQEIFIKAYRNLDKYSDEFKFSTWIMRISTNHVIDFRRKKKYVSVSYEEVDYDKTDNITPESIYIETEKSKAINELLGDLPIMYKEPIIMYHEKGLSYAEISEELDEPLSKIKNRIFRGRKMLKDNIINSSKSDLYGLQ